MIQAAHRFGHVLVHHAPHIAHFAVVEGPKKYKEHVEPKLKDWLRKYDNWTTTAASKENEHDDEPSRSKKTINETQQAVRRAPAPEPKNAMKTMSAEELKNT